MNTDNHMNKYLAASIVLAAVLVAGALWVTKESSRTEIAATPEIIPEASTEATLPTLPSDGPVQFPPYKTTTLPYPETHTISLDHLRVSFKIPKGYVAYQSEGYEGGYGTDVFIGKEVAPGHFKDAGIRISTFLCEEDHANYIPNGNNPCYLPREYVDVLFAQYSQFEFMKTQHLNLLGNRAVYHLSEIDNSPTITGYVQLVEGYQGSQEYGIEISGSIYGSGAQFDQRLFDQVVSSFTFN